MNHLFMFLFKHINLWNFNSSVFVDLVTPAIKFVEALKNFISQGTTKDKIESENFKFIEHLMDQFKLTESLIEKLIEAAVDSIKKLVTNIDKSYVEGEEMPYNLFVILAFANYVKAQNKWQKDMIYLKLASMILIHLFSKNNETLSDHEAITMVQLNYSDNKLNKKF